MNKLKNERVTLLKEFPMNFSSTPGSKPAADIVKAINDKHTPMSNNPAFPRQKDENGPSFEEFIGSNSFQRVVKNLEKYTGKKVNADSLGALYGLALGALDELASIEKKHAKELEKLAIELVMHEMGIEEGEIIFKVKIMGIQQIDASDQQKVSEDEQIEIEEKLFDKLSEVDVEVQKRRFINSLTHGAAVKGQYMFHLVDEQLNKINPKLSNLYGVTMSITDAIYWILSDKQVKALTSGNSEGELGKEKVVADENSVPVVYAKGATFAVLVHELIKGVMEVYALHGQSEDIDVQKAAMDIADSIDQETWDLRLGPAIWEQFRSMYPEELFEDDKRYLEKYLIMKLYKMPPEQFNKMMRMILAKNPDATNMLSNLLQEAVDELNEENSTER